MGARQSAVLMDKTYTAQTTSFNESAILDLSAYEHIQVIVFQVGAWTGTTPKLQLDLIAHSPEDAETVDFYNGGPQAGGFVYSLGPGCNNGNIVVPARMGFSYQITGTTPSIGFRIIVYGLRPARW